MVFYLRVIDCIGIIFDPFDGDNFRIINLLLLDLGLDIMVFYGLFDDLATLSNSLGVVLNFDSEGLFLLDFLLSL